MEDVTPHPSIPSPGAADPQTFLAGVGASGYKLANGVQKLLEAETPPMDLTGMGEIQSAPQR